MAPAGLQHAPSPAVSSRAFGRGFAGADTRMHKMQPLDDFLVIAANRISATAAGALHTCWQALNLLVVSGFPFVAGIALLRPSMRPAPGGQPICS